MECSIRAVIGRKATLAAEVLSVLAVISACAAFSQQARAAERVVLCEEFTSRM